MRKHLFLALPLASVLMLAGCSCGTGTCSIPADDCNTCAVVTSPAVVAAPAATVAQPAWEYVTASAKSAQSGVTQMTAEEYQALLASGKVREVGSDSAVSTPVVAAKPAVVKAAPVVAKAAPVKTRVQTVVETSSVPHIPAMPLPKGWDYIHEKDLRNGALNTLPVDQYYTQANQPMSRFNIEDI